MSQKILYLDLFGQQDRVNPRNKGLSSFVINQAWDTETKDLAADSLGEGDPRNTTPI